VRGASAQGGALPLTAHVRGGSVSRTVGKQLYLIDGHSQIYRAYYAPFRDLTSPSGEPTRATHVFSSMLLRLIADQKPDYLAMAMDGPVEKLQRRQLYAEYKVTRKPMPDDLLPQVERIRQIVEAMGIPLLEAEGYEADDILATAVEKLASKAVEIVLVSRDKDLDQLLKPGVVMYDPMKDERLDAERLEEVKGYRADQAVDVQALTGDNSDNVPGVPGIGPKTAAALVGQYGSVEDVLAHAEEMTPKLKENLLARAEQVALAKELVTLRRDVPVKLELDRLAFSGIRGGKVRPIFAELGMNRLLDQLDSLGVGGAEKEPQRPNGSVAVEGQEEYRRVDTVEALDALADELTGRERIGVDTETTSTRPMWAEMVGMSLAWAPGRAAYLPVKAPLGAKTLPVERLAKKLGPILSDPTVEKVGHNLKYDLIILGRAGIPLSGPMFDTIIAAHVLDATRPTYKLDALSAELLNHQCIPIQDVIGRGRGQITMDAADVDTVTVYAAEDADIALRLRDVLLPQLEQENLLSLFRDLEMPLMPVLAQMEQRGIRLDVERLREMEQELSKQADALRGRIVGAAGREFNVDSPKQLAEVLFTDLALPVIKRKKTGPSTDADVLEQLAAWHELPGLVLDYRQLTKLLSTYLDALAGCVHPATGRVHTSFQQTGTSTGRLSSNDPNLQNIPVRTKLGRRIRSAFVAESGSVLLSADYSQVELRVLAHLCQDETLLAAFADDQDIHRIVAAEVFGVKPDEVSPEQRARAKTVNFGIIYGQTAFGLSKTLRISRTEADTFIKQYRRRFPAIEEFLSACIRQAKEHGYVETILGRRRRIGHIEARNPTQRAQAERLAINSVVQGSAADIIKRAMVNIAGRVERDSRPTRILLQIHDELLFEIPRAAVEAEREMIVEEMSSPVTLTVPLRVDVGVGDNWMEAK